MTVHVAAFYHFFPFAEYIRARAPLKRAMEREGGKGTILLAPEGVNGTIAGPEAGVKAVLSLLSSLHPALASLEVKWSRCDAMPFGRAKVKLKKELISLGVPASPLKVTGEYVEPKDWNALIADPATFLLDTRNMYEVEAGTFEGAIDPGIRTFKALAAYVEKNLDPKKQDKIATFCTGGIRCEKFTAYLKEKGFREVYQLKGGILKYLQEIPSEESRFQGACFVFDERGAVE